jgi:hypothetical protein
VKRLLCVYLVVLLAVLAGCGDGRTDAEVDGELSSGVEETFEEGTLALTTGPGKKTSPEGTLSEGTNETGNAVLRLEGDPDTTFSGICTVGGEEQVLTGRVPKRFVFDLGDGSLECRIQKQDSGRGGLNAVLTVDNSTRSAQQINSKGETIELSYKDSTGG